jgi:hypothetical protein
VGRSSTVSGGPMPSSYAPRSIGVVLAAGFPDEDSTVFLLLSAVGVLPVLRRLRTAAGIKSNGDRDEGNDVRGKP